MCRSGLPKGPNDSFAPRQARFKKDGGGLSKSKEAKSCKEKCGNVGNFGDKGKGKKQANTECAGSSKASGKGGDELLDSMCSSDFKPRSRKKRRTSGPEDASRRNTLVAPKGSGGGSGNKAGGFGPMGQQVKINFVLGEFGFFLVPKEKDGNCFYHCIADALGIDTMEVRSQMGTFIKLSGREALVNDFNLIFYDDFSFEDLVHDVTSPGCWGGQHEMALAQHIFGREIVVFDIRETSNCPILVALFTPDKTLKTSFDLTNSEDLQNLKEVMTPLNNPICLLRVNDNHFDLLKPV